MFSYVTDGADETLRMPALVAAGPLGENGNRAGLDDLTAFAARPILFRLLEHFQLLLMVFVIIFVEWVKGASAWRFLVVVVDDRTTGVLRRRRDVIEIGRQ